MPCKKIYFLPNKIYSLTQRQEPKVDPPASSTSPLPDADATSSTLSAMLENGITQLMQFRQAAAAHAHANAQVSGLFRIV